MLTLERMRAAQEILVHSSPGTKERLEPKWNARNTVSVRAIAVSDPKLAAQLPEEVARGTVRLRLYKTREGNWTLAVPANDLYAWDAWKRSQAPAP